MREIVAAMVHYFRQVGTAIGLTTDVDQRSLWRPLSRERPCRKASHGGERLLQPVISGGARRRSERDLAKMLAGTYQGALHHADMQINSPYNTTGFRLASGTIGNPGRSSLEAACIPTH
jgi:hypothetical protein